ncbi:sigma-54-dependent Fis family transcriptional regulator [Desulfuromonas acetoxidans]|uniref:Sigma54 specific transcriptional regulator, Fis family n=1 Tax=Desulfuromonas acetoxidans (strain DSM 684 / 11070) TaxID=281689 RepID=Q1JXT1_DESA6|nr:sigma-54-dependent Fis family transcriptional regulator [Desulfuromonas acetoxidans]EAT15062.1 sigma54 specific transcriptional regulator, Fis family [Desulfuromonas acetoxidans DSM 684]MBF0646463.1 sigma-54-dependent Fis family transcriptional regulator [Desulfuromonas acetoxidans]NVD24988.1 sigma-54-dependent Fis family transcriptional regulator [Desulfuromonas acetoxidans]NVE15289.1 sigma-54-dependent Fis family transcriptional regulator [Desulfuromonas acetoxidans]
MTQLTDNPVHVQTILDSVADGVFTVDPQLRITSFNHAAEEITGFSRAEALGQPCCEIFRTNVCFDQCPLRKAFASGENITNIEVDVLDRHNREIPISVNASVLRDERGDVIGGVETFRDLSQLRALANEVQKQFSFHDMISRNPRMQQLFDILPDVANSDATVLLHGASGTGKELFARAIHNLSTRNNQPLVVINCGALPEQLLEAEIFGVRKGAYTGAIANRKGRLALAEGGTLFLDEIGDLPLSLQVKLLRVLENNEYQALGSDETRRADVRFVAASHRDLAHLVEEKRFRQDLYYRLNVVALHIPPLSERDEDIPLLLDMALQRFCHKHGKKIVRFSQPALEQLLAYPYEGNVRELLNIVERAVILCRGSQIEVMHIPALTSNALALKKNRCPDKDALSHLLQRFQGNRQQLAQHLGIDRTTLWRWLKKHQLN